MIRRSAVSIIVLVAVTSMTFGFFQNCARTPLERPSTAITLDSKGETAICLDRNFPNRNLQGYTVESYYVRNVNVLPWVGGLVADSDADGLPDTVESALGFDPVNPRSRSGALDRICYNSGNNTNNCPSVPAVCSQTPNALGISQCDIKALGLDQIFQHPTQGLDTDKDGIPDYFEILAGTSPIISDATQDPDHDNILNQEEFQRGSNPFFSDADLPSSSLMQANAQKMTGVDVPPACEGEFWKLSLEHVQYVPTLEYNSPLTSGPLQGHKAGENVVIAVIKLRPQPGIGGNAIIFSQTFVINLSSRDLPIDSNQFQWAGDVLP